MNGCGVGTKLVCSFFLDFAAFFVQTLIIDLQIKHCQKQVALFRYNLTKQRLLIFLTDL